MNIFTGVVLYICIWWVTFMITLTIGVGEPHEDEEFGTAGSAPAQPHIGKRMLITFAVSFVIWIIIRSILTYIEY